MKKKLSTLFFCFLVSLGLILPTVDFWHVTLSPGGREHVANFVRYMLSDKEFSIAPKTCAYAAGDIDIFMTGTAENFDGLLTTVFSAVENKCQMSTYRFRIFTNDLTEEQKQALKRLENDRVSVRFSEYVRNDDCASRLAENKAFTFLLADSARDVRKALYLSDDTLVMRDLTPVFEPDLTEFAAGAVRKDEPHKAVARGFGWQERDEPPFEYPYFDTGVMLLNLDRLRQEGFAKKACRFADKYGVPLNDEGEVWNGISFAKAIFLPYAFNVMTGTFSVENFMSLERIAFLRNQYSDYNPLPDFPEEVYKEAVVIRYTSDKGKLAKHLNPLRDSYAQKARARTAP